VIPIHESAGAVTFEVKIHPRARKNTITGELGGALKLSITSPPIDGRANQACIEFFAKLLKVPRSSVTIASGHSNRKKVVRVAGLTTDEVRRCIVVSRHSTQEPL
jgi:uncharacterized protein (TIGR00251 family)